MFKKENDYDGNNSGIFAKIILLVVLIIAIIALFYSCSILKKDNKEEGVGENTNKKVNEQTTGVETETTENPYSENLANLFPKELVMWRYSGSFDYLHQMETISVMDMDNQKVYKINGEVEDLSGGDSGSDYNFSITYTVKDDVVYQNQNGMMLLDSPLNGLILIKEPLQEGNYWTQQITDNQGNILNIESTISKVEGTDQKMYYVDYHILEEDRYEHRVFKDGMGVVNYNVEMLSEEGDKYEVSYHLDEIKVLENITGEQSGYTHRIPTQEELKNATSDMSNNQNITMDNMKIIRSLDSKDIPKVKKSLTEPTDEQRTQIENLILDFNKGWVVFANTGDMSLRKYLVPSKNADRIVDRYIVKDTNLRFELIDIGKIGMSGDHSYAYVHEIILKDVNGKVKTYEYFWEYKIVKTDDGYKIDRYSKYPRW